MSFWIVLALITICGFGASQPQDRYNQDPKWDLHRVLWTNDEKLIENEAEARRLIESGVNVNLSDGDEQLPIHWASLRGFEKVVQLLLERGDRNQLHMKDSRGDTPLHKAAWQGNAKVVAILLNNGADIHSRNNKGQDPLDIAIEYGDRRVADLLDAFVKGQSTSKMYLQKQVIDLIATSRVSNDHNAQKESSTVCKAACDKYSQQLPADYVLGGLEASNQFPWMAALGYLDSNGVIEYKCGATIVSEMFVLTAAHCTNDEHPPIVVRLGTSNLNDKNASHYYIKEIIRHGSYSKEFKKNDIALIQLSKNIAFTSNIRPACLETDVRDQNPNMKLDVTSWGSSTSQQTNTSNKLLKTQATTIPLTQCNQMYAQQANVPPVQSEIHESQYCVHTPNGSNDGCALNSGAPLQIFHNPHTAHVVGITSFGNGCSPNAPGIYTRVAYYLDWIASNVWPNVQ